MTKILDVGNFFQKFSYSCFSDNILFIDFKFLPLITLIENGHEIIIYFGKMNFQKIYIRFIINIHRENWV